MTKTMQIARDVLAAVGGAKNVTANDICMTRLRLLTEDPSLIDTEQLSGTSGVLGIVKRGTNGVEVVFGVLRISRGSTQTPRTSRPTLPRRPTP